jgi:hypothetical protein
LGDVSTTDFHLDKLNSAVDRSPLRLPVVLRDPSNVSQNAAAANPQPAGPGGYVTVGG